ncbi:MAG: radical SAM protein [Candidatus Zixiibacteriota bacterium]|nr:MAG: radical SAM protein [candidate division Zixibacteria bacterium]
MKQQLPEEIAAVGQRLFRTLDSCELCPMECRVNRLEGETGECGCTAELKVASCNLHFGEEPPLSGGGGSGTIFLSGCSLSCRYCQNYPISQLITGSISSVDELKTDMLALQRRGAENINFVTPDHMLPMILMALGQAKADGLGLPIVYNCSGYMKMEIARLLDGIIDIYLVDMRYDDDATAKAYSGCEKYVEHNRAAVKEMYRQVGALVVNKYGLATSGVIVRHLVLPENLSGSAGIFNFLAEEVSPDIYVSLMSQYFPAHKAVGDEKIGRRIRAREYQAAVDAFYQAGLKNGYMQDTAYESV